MSYQNANLPIQIAIENYGNLGRTYQVIDFIRNTSDRNTWIDINTEGFLYAPGKIRSLKAIYYPIICNVEGDCNQNLCSPGTPAPPSVQFFDITECTATLPRSINKNDIRLLDTGWDFSDNALKIMNSTLPELRRLIATQFLVKLSFLAGIHPDGSDEKRVVLINNLTGAINPVGLSQIQREYADAGFDQPNILGGGEVYTFLSMSRIGGLNQLGQQINMVDTSNIWYDDGISASVLDDTANGDHIFTIDPRVFKFVTYSENAGIFRTDLSSLADIDAVYQRGGTDYIEGTFYDPVTGLLFDLFVNYDKCSHTWTFWIKLNWDFFVMPDTVCSTPGVNGIMHWRTCPELVPVCPTGSLVPSPTGASTLSWVVALPCSYPYTIADMQIGNRGAQLNMQVTDIAGLTAAFNAAYGKNIFTNNGSAIQYTGPSAFPLSGTINGNEVVFAFS